MSDFMSERTSPLSRTPLFVPGSRVTALTHFLLTALLTCGPYARPVCFFRVLAFEGLAFAASAARSSSVLR